MIVCLPAYAEDQEVFTALSVLKTYGAELTSIPGFTWAWNVPIVLPASALSTLKTLDALIDTRP